MTPRYMHTAIFLSGFLVLPTMVQAHPRVESEAISLKCGEKREIFPPGLKVYSNTEVLRIDLSKKVKEPTLPPGFGLGGGWGQSARDLGISSEEKRAGYLPVLLSAVIPGSGEIYMGYYVRGSALLAAELGAWASYIYYHNNGLDSRKDYERFADEHWDFDKWWQEHPAGTPNSFNSYEELDSVGRSDSYHQWPGYMMFISKSEDKQHYYENIGKYDWFISGWDDWDWALPFAHDTASRTTYRAMRKRSNDELDRANKFVYLSIAVRVYSLIETLFLARGASREDRLGFSIMGLRLEARPAGLYSSRLSLSYRFK